MQRAYPDYREELEIVLTGATVCKAHFQFTRIGSQDQTRHSEKNVGEFPNGR